MSSRTRSLRSAGGKSGVRLRSFFQRHSWQDQAGIEACRWHLETLPYCRHLRQCEKRQWVVSSPSRSKPCRSLVVSILAPGVPACFFRSAFAHDRNGELPCRQVSDTASSARNDSADAHLWMRKRLSTPRLSMCFLLSPAPVQPERSVLSVSLRCGKQRRCFLPFTDSAPAPSPRSRRRGCASRRCRG